MRLSNADVTEELTCPRGQWSNAAVVPVNHRILATMHIELKKYEDLECIKPLKKSIEGKLCELTELAKGATFVGPRFSGSYFVRKG